MVKVRPFAALRPAPGLAAEVAAPPYDVVNSEEAKALAGPKSLLHITKAEIDFEPVPEDSDPRVYTKAVENFALWQQNGWLVRDPKPCYYLYSQKMGERTQYGFVLCADTEDYKSGTIKKHELTRKDKEDDRMVHVKNQKANIEPVFFAFHDNARLAQIISEVSSSAPEYRFTDENGFEHAFWTLDSDPLIEEITGVFENEVDAFYIADGHHRTAAAARVSEVVDGEEARRFLAVCFPESQLRIMDYNRVVRDLAGLEPTQLIARIGENFDIVCKGSEEPYSPEERHYFSMYLEGKWYSLKARPGSWDSSSAIASLDVSILSDLVLDRILGIKDLRRDKRIDFVGGIRGLGELKRRVDSGEMKVAFALYPVSLSELMRIADEGSIMPPKTTWFEPKLRSGLAIHTF